MTRLPAAIRTVALGLAFAAPLLSLTATLAPAEAQTAARRGSRRCDPRC